MRTVEKKMWLVLSCFLLLMGILARPASAVEVRSKAEVQQEIDQYVKNDEGQSYSGCGPCHRS